MTGGDSPPGKTWAKYRRLFMTSMKAIEKSVAKLVKKFIHSKGDRKKSLHKRDRYESDSSDSDSE